MKLLVLLLLCAPLYLFAQQRTLAVTGTSTIMVKPDYANFTVHIDKFIPATQPWTEPQTDQLIDALVMKGIPPQDIEILERLPTLAVDPPYPYPEPVIAPVPMPADEITPMPEKGNRKKKKVVEEPTIPIEPSVVIPPEPAMKGMRTTYRVTVRNMKLLPDAIGIAQELSHYQPDAHYDVTDRNPLRAQALREALDNARAKATVLVEKMGGTLGEIISIDDSESGSFFSSIFDIARMVTSGKFDGNIINLPEVASVKVTYSVK